MLRGWFESTFGESALAAQFVVALVIVVLVLAIVAWLFGKRSKRDAVRGPARGRQPRLSVMEAARVDSRRRLVLVRRDHVEHLVLIGGPSDIVVEPNIIRGRPASSAIARGKQIAAQRAQAHQAQLQQAQLQQAPVQHPAAQRVPQTEHQQSLHPSPERAIPDAASPSAAAMAAAVLAGTDETTERRDNTARAHLIPSSPRNEPPITQTVKAEPAPEEVVRAEADRAPEVRPQEEVHADRQEPAAASDTDYTSDEQPADGNAGGSAHPIDVASLAAGAAALTAAAGSRAAGNDAGHAQAELAGQQHLPDSRPDNRMDVVPEARENVAEQDTDHSPRTEYPHDDADEDDDGWSERDRTEEPVDAPAEFRAGAERADPETEFYPDPQNDEALPETGSEPDSEPEETVENPPLDHDQSWQETEAATDQNDEPLPEPVAATADEVEPAETDHAQPIDFRNADPYADVEHEFRKAFETSLRGLKAKVHEELAPAETDRTAAQAMVDDTGPVPADAPVSALGETLADDAVAGPSGTATAHAAESELLRSVSGFDGETDPSDLPDPESPDTEDASAIPVSDSDQSGRQRLESGLPAELAFLDESPDDVSADQPDTADIDEPDESDGQPGTGEPPAGEKVEEVAAIDLDDRSPEEVVRNPVIKDASEPAPRTNPFPTIPESVRKSVMAAASRAISPELAAGLEQGGGKDVAATTLGDLAKRLEKALSEQSATLDYEPDADDDDDERDDDDGAVIDFNALRRDAGGESLEDEMAKLLNDLTGDTNKAS